MTSDIAAVTMSSSDKALYPVSNFPVLGGNYFGFVGKTIQIDLFGRLTTGATPGNFSWDLYWGTGADANGTLLEATPGVCALVANATNVTWTASFKIRCTTIGSAGALFATGWSLFNVAGILSTVQPSLYPMTAPATSASVDLTAANIVSVQVKRSGSTGESMQVHQLHVTALN